MTTTAGLSRGAARGVHRELHWKRDRWLIVEANGAARYAPAWLSLLLLPLRIAGVRVWRQP